MSGRRRALATLGLLAVAVALGVLCVAFAKDAIDAHRAEYDAQIAMFGFYGSDVSLDYGRHVRQNLGIVGASLTGIGSGASAVVALLMATRVIE